MFLRCRSSRSERKYSFQVRFRYSRSLFSFSKQLARQFVRIGHRIVPLCSRRWDLDSLYGTGTQGKFLSSEYMVAILGDERLEPCRRMYDLHPAAILITRTGVSYINRRLSRNYESTNLGWLVEFVKSSNGLSTKTRTFRRCEISLLGGLNVFPLKDSSLWFRWKPKRTEADGRRSRRIVNRKWDLRNVNVEES